MPFTPLHMGPGLALKAVGGRRFSLRVFGFAQVAMDVEPLVGILRDAAVLHGWTHGYLGAALTGLLVWLIAPWPSRRILRWWNAQLDAHGFGWLPAASRSTGCPRRPGRSAAHSATSRWTA